MLVAMAWWRFFFFNPFSVSMMYRQMARKNSSYSQIAYLSSTRAREFFRFSFRRKCATKWGEIRISLWNWIELRKKFNNFCLKAYRDLVGTSWRAVANRIINTHLFFSSRNTKYLPRGGDRVFVNKIKLIFYIVHYYMVWIASLLWICVKSRDAVLWFISSAQKVEFKIILAPSI